MNGAVFAILGMAQQKLPQRRMFEIAKFLLKDIAGIATANIQTGSEPFCGQDVKRLMSNARNTYTSSDQSKQRLPYKRRGQRCQPHSTSQQYQCQQRSSVLERGQPFSRRGTNGREKEITGSRAEKNIMKACRQ